jgi:hypothetical protein
MWPAWICSFLTILHFNVYFSCCSCKYPFKLIHKEAYPYFKQPIQNGRIRGMVSVLTFVPPCTCLSQGPCGKRVGVDSLNIGIVGSNPSPAMDVYVCRDFYGLWSLVEIQAVILAMGLSPSEGVLPNVKENSNFRSYPNYELGQTTGPNP